MVHRRSTLSALIGACAVAVVQGTVPARAEDARPRDTSADSLFHPTPDDALRAFTPDRPGRSTTPITVDAGHWQIESDFLNVTTSARDGVTTRGLILTDPVIKLGLTSFVELDLALGGYDDFRLSAAAGGTLSHARGYGDTALLGKVNLLGNDGGSIAFALAPYLLLPTGARGITAGQVQGGLIAPVTLKLPQDFELTLQTEVDALANQNGPGTHVNLTNIATLTHPIPGIRDLTGLAEIYTSLSTERGGDDVYTADLALAYQLGPGTEIDAGTNIGLNRGAPDLQVYSGVTRRF